MQRGQYGQSLLGSIMIRVRRETIGTTETHTNRALKAISLLWKAEGHRNGTKRSLRKFHSHSTMRRSFPSEFDALKKPICEDFTRHIFISCNNLNFYPFSALSLSETRSSKLISFPIATYVFAHFRLIDLTRLFIPEVFLSQTIFTGLYPPQCEI